MLGTVFDIQRYSIHDGPGIRTVVFLKGCPLRCLWCCNPESQAPQPELEFRESLCRGSAACLAACPTPGAIRLDAPGPGRIDRSLCTACGVCVAACPQGALRLVGQERSVADVMAEILKDAAYYRRSGGGLTLSGGEPLAQPAFARTLLAACHERNIHTALETTGCVSWPILEAVLSVTDLFLFDLKHMSSAEHRRLTGAPNERILDNARRLAATGAPMIVRVPLVPGLNTDVANLYATATFAAALRPQEVHVMPFHQFGRDKYARLGRRYGLEGLAGLRDTAQGQALIAQAQGIFERAGLRVFVGG